MKNIPCFLAAVLLGLGLLSCSTEKNKYELIPYPNRIEQLPGRFVFDNQTNVFVSPDCGDEIARIASDFVGHFNDISGKTISLSTTESAKNTLTVKRDETLGEEAYKLAIDKKKIEITVSSPNGLRLALQTVKQLLPTAIYGKVEAADADWSVPCANIEDEPRFGYRGMHLDVCRHFFDTDEVKRYLDVMAAHKLNVLHWHLTEDQGWRIEIKKYPKLTEIGSIRPKTMIAKEWDNYDNTPYGGYYTQEQLREIVDYAAGLGITIIPEIDLPGHMQAALASYPHLGCTGGPYEVSGQWGVRDDVLCVGKESTFEFIENVLLEVMDIFPSKYIHIGGDECPKVRWEKCQACQARIRQLGLKDDEEGKAEHHLQSNVMIRIAEFLNQHGRSIIGWDEILEGKLEKKITVMSWRGEEGGIKAVSQGHQAIMTPTNPLYFDYYQTQDTEHEPLCIGGHNPVEKVYAYNPIPKVMTEEQAKLVLGVQANLWTEYISTPEQLEYMLLPRLAALSEIQWTQVENKDYDRFLHNLDKMFAIYDVMGLQYATHVFDVKGEYTVKEGKEGIEVSFQTMGNAPIYYTLDGSEPTTQSTLYTAPFFIIPESDSCQLKAVAVRPDRNSRTLEKTFRFSKSTGHFASLKDQPSEKYTFTGATLLTDGIRGDFNYANGCWLGFINTPVDATIDLGKSQEISSVKTGSLVQYSEYVFPPTKITVYAADGNEEMKMVGTTDFPVAPTQDEDGVREYSCDFAPVQASKVRVVIETTSQIPAWHGAKGEKGWLFIDEITVH
ncbi:MAG: family 20 glycosylhydrolase [Coprobacter sp.]|nr:family 20 glycosylhydrolase [Coprobacter sp.]